MAIFSTSGNSVVWAGARWVAVGVSGGSGVIAISTTGSSAWSIIAAGNGGSSLSTAGYGVSWNGKTLVAVGDGSLNSISYSTNGGLNWTGAGKTIFSLIGYGIAWNGKQWMATGTGSANSLAYSNDGINWFGLGKTIFNTARGVASNSLVGANKVDSQLVLSDKTNRLNNNNVLDVVADRYNNSGYSNMIIGIESTDTE